MHPDSDGKYRKRECKADSYLIVAKKLRTGPRFVAYRVDRSKVRSAASDFRGPSLCVIIMPRRQVILLSRALKKNAVSGGPMLSLAGGSISFHFLEPSSMRCCFGGSANTAKGLMLGGNGAAGPRQLTVDRHALPNVRSHLKSQNIGAGVAGLMIQTSTQ